MRRTRTCGSGGGRLRPGDHGLGPLDRGLQAIALPGVDRSIVGHRMVVGVVRAGCQIAQGVQRLDQQCGVIAGFRKAHERKDPVLGGAFEGVSVRPLHVGLVLT